MPFDNIYGGIEIVQNSHDILLSQCKRIPIINIGRVLKEAS